MHTQADGKNPVLSIPSDVVPLMGKIEQALLDELIRRGLATIVKVPES